ncbi:hypothetical protein EC968_000136 [Mortierella alpina]|nr:hypothetical protein EC968_000136 [Mortierella alpina]
MRLYQKFGHSPPSIQPRLLFPTTASRQLYEFAEGILNTWDTSSKIKRKDCMVAMSGIINTLDPDQKPHFSTFQDIVSQSRQEDLFNVTERQQTLFEMLDKILGYGEQQSISRLRLYCSRKRDNLEQDKEQDLVTILALQKITTTSEHEDVFIWRGIARILHSHEVVIRVGELGSSSTREDRRDIEEQFGSTESGVRSRKIDILHQLCPRGAKSPMEIVAWEAKPDAASAETLQIQLRKNIRTNASIMNKLAPYLDPIEPGVFGAGVISEDLIELPRAADEIMGFLFSGSMSALLRVELELRLATER